MASTTTTTTTTTTATSTRALRSRPSLSRLRGPSSFASTPNLNTLFTAQSKLLPPSLGLSRKASLAALTPSSLASIPDVSESYALDTVLSDSSSAMVPANPGRQSAEDLLVGDTVDVPGGMYGTVRFVGTVQGKKGTFAGVELHQDFAARGKNNGDVDGISYFTTSTPGAGIFVPVVKASRRGSSNNSFPMTPTASTNGRANGVNYTPPGLPKFSASVGPGARAPSPGPKRPPRTSLPRPDSPVRRTQMTPGPRPSIGTPAPRPPARYGSPTNNSRFTQSVRGTAGDPNKKPSRLDRKPSIGGPRSASALGSAPGFDEESTPSLHGSPRRVGPNGLGSSVSVLNLRRPASRANAANEEEMERLRSQLEDRDRQLKDQATTLAEMESSLVELQGIIESTDMPKMRRNSLDDKDSAQLRAMLREKNDKIAMLTSEFDAHRADFRSTIDTLEMASTETERVYEKRIEELMGDIRELEARNLDVDSVASQLRQLEELVQELEEGLEDARRGEAEARGEAEFLRGEVERTKTELRREREQSGPGGGGGAPHDDKGALLKELEQKEDEIRGLKAIIHSLSRDSIGDAEDRTPTQRRGSFMNGGEDGETARASLARQVAELQLLLDKKNGREEELEQELEALRGGNLATQKNSGHRSSLRDSRDTVIPVRFYEPISPEVNHKREPNHRRGNTLDTMHESDAYSTATENSTLWCEICETGGHDILTCTNMFGPEGAKAASDIKTGKDVVREGLKLQNSLGVKDAHPAPLSPTKPKAAFPAAPAIKILPNPMESGPVAGKESGVVDTGKWCAVCERDGHDSVDCPFEDAF